MTPLQAKVLDAIRAGIGWSVAITVAVDMHEAQTGDHKSFRKVDNAMRVLRRAGKIVFDSKKGWTEVK